MSTTSNNPSSSAHLDLANALANVGDADALREMLVMLQELLASDVPQIAQLVQSGDFAQAQLLLHSLKGCLPIFTRPELASELVNVELLSKTNAGAGCAEAYGALHPKLDALLAEISHHLAHSAG